MSDQPLATVTRWCLAYNRPSTTVPDHVPGAPAHALGHRVIEVRPDQLDIACQAFPDGQSLSVVEMPPGEHEVINIADWEPRSWQLLTAKFGQEVPRA